MRSVLGSQHVTLVFYSLLSSLLLFFFEGFRGVRLVPGDSERYGGASYVG